MATNGFKVVVINLESRIDRKIEMEQQLSRIGWTAQFDKAVRPSHRGDFPSIGSRGCFLSHLSVLKRSIGLKQLVLLEDDVNFAPDFSRRWPQMYTELQEHDWSICYFGHILADLAPGLNLLNANQPVRCTHFMLFQGEAIPILIDALETILGRPAGHPDGGPMHVDGAYSTIRAQHPGLKTYAIAPELGYQRPSRTDIADPKWFDRIRILEPVVAFARKLKGAHYTKRN